MPPEFLIIDGVRFRRIERLPRNARPGDMIRLTDRTSIRDGEQTAYVTVTGADTYPERIAGWRRFAPEAVITFKLRPQDDRYLWRSWGYRLTYRDGETKEPIWLYRAVSAADRAALADRAA